MTKPSVAGQIPLRPLIHPDNMNEHVETLLTVVGDVLSIDDEGYSHEMLNGDDGREVYIFEPDNTYMIGYINHLYVVDGHLIVSAWFTHLGGTLVDMSFTFNTNETLLLVPLTPEQNPCHQEISDSFVVTTIGSYCVGTRVNVDV